MLCFPKGRSIGLSFFANSNAICTICALSLLCASVCIQVRKLNTVIKFLSSHEYFDLRVDFWQIYDIISVGDKVAKVAPCATICAQRKSGIPSGICRARKASVRNKRFLYKIEDFAANS